MAGYSALPSLDIDPIGIGAAHAASMQSTLDAQQQYDARAQLLPGQLEAQKLENDTNSQLAPLQIQSAKSRSALETMSLANTTLAQVARDAQAADPEDASAIWDEGMKAAADKGVVTAKQYVGHYRADLAEKIGDAYGSEEGGKSKTSGGGAAAANAPDPGSLDMQFAKLPPQQVQKSLSNLNRVIQSFNTVKDKQSWDNEIQSLREAGIPIDQILPNTDWNPLNYATAKRLVDNQVPYRDAAERAIARQTAGVGAPMVPNKVMQIGNRLYSVDPYGQNATQIASADKFEYEGPEKTGGGAKVFNPVTGTLTAPGASGAPSGSFMDFADRMEGLENGTGDPAARNPRSTAMGNGQFIKATWLQEARDALPQQTAGKSDDQVLAMRADPGAARLVTAAYAQKNSQTLMDRGLPVTTGTLALAHRLGPDGAVKLLHASADTPLTDILPANVIAANPDMKGQTAGQYANRLISQIGNQPVLTPTGDEASIPGNPNLHGDAYLKSMPDQSIANQVKAIAEGREQQPSSFFLKTPYGQMMMRSLAQYDPGFDLSLYQSRVAANTDLAKGKMGQNVTSFNTTIGHLGALSDAIDKLQNTSFPLVNQAYNVWRNNTGDPRVNAFNVNVDAAASELTRAFRGTGGNESDIQAWKKTLSAANSPQQLHAAVDKAVDLLESRIDATGDQYGRAMRKTVQPDSLLSPVARSTLQKLKGGSANTSQGGGNFVNGKIYRDKAGNQAKYQNGQWVPVQ